MKERLEVSNGWSLYFLICVLIVTIGSIIQNNGIFMVISATCGVIYTLLIARGKKIAYLFGVINVGIYGIILFLDQVYASALYNLLYSLPMLIYGYIIWTKVENKANDGVKQLSDTTKIMGLLLCTGAVFIVSLGLSIFGSNLIVLDSIAAVFGAIGVFLMSNKYVEQWPMFIICNVANLIIWILMSANNLNNLPFVLMWIVYTINAIYGYYKWNKDYAKAEIVLE